MMTPSEKESFIRSLEDELLQGSVILSEWAVRISRDAAESFISGQYLASLLTSMAAIETQLRAESGDSSTRLQILIDASSITPELKTELHELRKYRNRWVHVREPWEDSHLLNNADDIDVELFNCSRKGVEALLRVLFWEQGT